MHKPKILFVDIETAPLLAYTWNVGKTHLSPENIAKERQVICICYKFSDSNIVHSLSFNIGMYDLGRRDDNADKEMLKKFTAIAKKADLVVAHNGVRFDFAILTSRLVKHKIKPLDIKLVDDSYLQSKRIGFSSRKLGYLGAYLDIGQKHDYGQNYRMWVRICRGSRADLRKMITYCKQDVTLLEKVYQRLLPYVKSSYNYTVEAEDFVCSGCGSHNLIKNGIRKRLSGVKQRFLCTKCGKSTEFTEKNLTKLQARCKLLHKRRDT